MRVRELTWMVALVVLSGPAQAAFITTDRTVFQNNLNVGTAYTETFDAEVPETASLAYSGGVAFAYTATAVGGDALVTQAVVNDPVTGLPVNNALGAFDFASSLVLTFTSGNVTAVGGDFFLTDTFGNPLADTPITVTTDTGLTTTFTPAGYTNSFVGFLSDTPFSTLTVSVDPDAVRFVNADNLTVGQFVQDPATVVPVPPTVLFVGLAAVAGGLGRRLRRAA